ncbi:acyl-CoA synthetase [Cupriavidus numazuensis]|uniref:Long-chain-fatty-acid--CoA ligase n=1 Tax=Cupriavidus numazuensis TaxID=221992 RepID=A0ABN7QG18_9BURK|nr:long-chain fatty acid--CoA ligase [Cupriavidus numazuensis]CAG2160451.1 Long-chain-fatty-acid--CoA ligase [Cupriavidus numazuensis]
MQLTQGLHRSLQLNPDRVVTVFRDRRRTYREFADRVARLAGALQALGMAAGDRVGMLALNSDRYLEYAMAVWWGGGVMNPVNIRWSVPEIVYSLDDCDTRILIVDDHFLHMADGISATARHAPVVIHAGDGPAPDGMLSFETLIADAAPVPDAARGYDDLAIVMYTGGTTGFPKGVEQTHMSLWCGSIQRMADLPPLRGGSALHASPFFHIAAFTRVVAQFIAGEQHVILPMFDAAQVLETIERERVTEIAFVPTMIQMLIQHPDFTRRDLSSVRRLGYGASPFNAAVLERTLEQFPGVEFVHSYGLTETMIVASNPPENHGKAARERGLHLSVGRAGYGLSVRIVDREGNEVPRGTVGELIVRGASVTRRYWNKPEETAKAFRNGWMHTGDGAYMDAEGHIFIVDRIKDMIVSGGENVYSAEVENAMGRHPAVAMCAAIGIPSEAWGEAVHAVVVLRPGMTATAEDIREHCRTLIAGYKCPKTVEFRSELPLSGTGKVLKRDLRAPYWSGKDRAVH